MTRSSLPALPSLVLAVSLALGSLAACQPKTADKAPQAVAAAPATTSTTETAPPEGKTIVVPPGATVTITPAPEAAAVAPAAKPAARAKARTARQSEPIAAMDLPPTAGGCPDCGTVESVRQVEQKGKGTGLGVVGGAVLGGLLGHQVGGGRGQDLATIAGAVGGGYAGHKVEEKARSTTSWEITVRFEDGSSRVIHQASQPSWREGDRVKVVDGRITAR